LKRLEETLPGAQSDLPQYPPLDLIARVVEHGPTVKIDLSGELDIAAQPVVQQAIDEAFERRPRQVVLNLSELTFMDSTGVHLAIKAHGLAAANDTDLVLIPGPPAVQRMFAIAHAAHETVPLPWAQTSPSDRQPEV
jgi:anti-sigma B factor antagonist